VARAIRELEDSALAAQVGALQELVAAPAAVRPTLPIGDSFMANVVGEYRQHLAALRKSITADTDPLRKERHAAWKTVTGMQDGPLSRLDALDHQCADAITDWHRAEQARVDRERLAA
jgi:hypothetical protein